MLKLNDIECFILDMDGTIYLSGRVLHGAKEMLALLEERGLPYYFFTNNTSKSTEMYVDKLYRLGFGDYPQEKIITACDVTADYVVKTYGKNPKAFVVGTQALRMDFESHGIDCIEEGVPDCLIVGFDTTFNFAKATIAVDLLREGVPFLATNVDTVCPLDNGKVLPDCASMCAMLTHATGAKPKFLGKPFPETSKYIQGFTGIPLNRTAMIGDRLYTDMRMAKESGMCAIGVLSGEMTKKDIEESSIRPDYVFNCMMDVYHAMKE